LKPCGLPCLAGLIFCCAEAGGPANAVISANTSAKMSLLVRIA
jgi:hypothetical protein